jgi:Ala-tRNA(Pro) deacylase
MAARRLTELLDRHEVPYVTITHSPAYTAQGIAQSAHIPGGEMAKTVVVKADGKLVLVVLPASRRIDMDAFREAIGVSDVELATEHDFLTTFTGCELGAMPPFGILWDVPVFVSKEMAEHEVIAFNAGTHTELVQMRYDDFERVVKPKVVSLRRVLA